MTNKRLEQYEKEESNREKAIPQRRILKKFDFLDSSDTESAKNPYLLDGFFLVNNNTHLIEQFRKIFFS